MSNKLCSDDIMFEHIERKIINTKFEVLDEFITFGNNKLNFKYLKDLNNFLFLDLYNKNDLGLRKLSNDEMNVINKSLNYIEKICLTTKNINNILSILEYLWNLQIFKVGNTRTLLAYLKILNLAYCLNLDIDMNKEIESKPSMFYLNNFVNQKRLTKTK